MREAINAHLGMTDLVSIRWEALTMIVTDRRGRDRGGGARILVYMASGEKDTCCIFRFLGALGLFVAKNRRV